MSLAYVIVDVFADTPRSIHRQAAATAGRKHRHGPPRVAAPGDVLVVDNGGRLGRRRCVLFLPSPAPGRSSRCPRRSAMPSSAGPNVSGHGGSCSWHRGFIIDGLGRTRPSYTTKNFSMPAEWLSVVADLDRWRPAGLGSAEPGGHHSSCRSCFVGTLTAPGPGCEHDRGRGGVFANDGCGVDCGHVW